MFTGIIESLGIIKTIEAAGKNKTFWIESPLSSGFKVDQSVSHSGVCLTIEAIKGNSHRVTAIHETLQKTTLQSWKEGETINLEQCLKLNDRIDGHLVQGHVDSTAKCIKRKEKKGSWEFDFEILKKFSPLVIEKGSICVNGISLTAFNVEKEKFTVAVIPYTFEHTNIKEVKKDSQVNLEFDLIGKYLIRTLSLLNTKR